VKKLAILLVLLMTLSLGGCFIKGAYDPNKTYTGTLIIKTSPSKAEAYVDDKYLGITPLRLEGVLGKWYDIRIEKEGYLKKWDRIYLEPGTVKELYYRLTERKCETCP